MSNDGIKTDAGNFSFELGEVYWLLSQIDELLTFIRQYADNSWYNECDALFTLVAKACLGSPIDVLELEKYISKVKLFAGSSREHNFAYTLGLAIKYRLLGDKKELISVLRGIVNDAKRFMDASYMAHAVDAIFQVAVALDIVSYSLTSGKEYELIKKELVSLVDNLIETISIDDPNKKIKLLYALSTVNPEKSVDLFVKREKEYLEILQLANPEYKVYALKPLALARSPYKQLILNDVTRFFREREYCKVERKILREVFSRILSPRERNMRSVMEPIFEEHGSIIGARIIMPLDDSDIAAIKTPRILQLSLIAIGMCLSGYNEVYTVPSLEKEDYINWIRDRDRLKRFTQIPRKNVQKLCEDYARQKIMLGFTSSILLATLSIMIGYIIGHVLNLEKILLILPPVVLFLVYSFIDQVVKKTRGYSFLDVILEYVLHRNKLKKQFISECRKKLRLCLNGED